MTVPTSDELLAAWTDRAATRRVRAADACHRGALRLLADGAPVAPTSIAEATGQDVSAVQRWLAEMQATGYELDDAGRLVGAALTLRPTAHRFRVRGHDLYAWCGFDTLFLPILLDEPAEVASNCPVTGQPIRLEVTADGTLRHVQPPTTVVAIVGPDVLEACNRVGPGSPICEQMPLLADVDAAQLWVRGRRGIAILELDAAAVLARAYAEHQGCC